MLSQLTAVRDYAERVHPGARLTGCTARPLTGGCVSASVERLTLHLTAGHEPLELELVRKQASAHEIAGLRAAQLLRPDATAIPELVAWGDDWLITPLAPGFPLADAAAPPASLFDSLAALHARFQGGEGLPGAIPRVSPQWWRSLSQHWVAPALREHASRHPPETTERAQSLIARAATWPAAAETLAALPATLLHGDVHRANVLADGDRAVLIDWGSSRVGPAALDLANLVPAGSAAVIRYASTWRQLTGGPLPAQTLELGYRWAALQIPVQYLPWTAAYRPSSDYTAALDQIDEALTQLTQVSP